MSVRTPAALLKLESIEYILLHLIVTWWKIQNLPETNSKFAPENGWLEYDPFLFWDGLF